MTKILATDKISPEGIKILSENFVVDEKDTISSTELKQIIHNYDCLIVRSQTKVTSEIIESAKNLKLIGRAGVGVDNIDVDKATEKGIIVMNVPGANTISAAEHTIGLLLALARNIPKADLQVKNKIWNREKLTGTQLYGKTLGIIGLGRIGKEVAKRAISFGMEILSYDPFINPESLHATNIKMVDLETLCKNSDFITIHTPLTEKTKNLIDGNIISKMKDGVRIINCARGGIIDEDALYHSLKSGKVSSAALDVFSKEPPWDSPLLTLNNVIFTPHLGAATQEAQVNVAIELANTVKEYFLKGILKNTVNIQFGFDEIKDIENYLPLAEKLGSFAGQMITTSIEEVMLEACGEISNYNTYPLLIASVKGLLQHILDIKINYVNAPYLAKERGINLSEKRTAYSPEFTNLLKLFIKTKKEFYKISGTLIENKEPRLVEIEDIEVDLPLFGNMLLIKNLDRPGVIGFLGTVLGNKNINIADMRVGRRKPRTVAITIILVDEVVPSQVINEIKSFPNIESVNWIQL